ncbi:unnamed protein product [Urochloa humidicola]
MAGGVRSNRAPSLRFRRRRLATIKEVSEAEERDDSSNEAHGGGGRPASRRKEDEEVDQEKLAKCSQKFHELILC